MDWQPIETAPENERILVFYPIYKRALIGMHYTKPYHNRGCTGWRVSIHPADRWEWMRFPPTHWQQLPKPPSAEV